MGTFSQKLSLYRSGWYVWLFPFFAILICLWLFTQYLEQKGPEITVRFDDGSSIQAEKTKLRFRGVTIGTVKKVSLSPDDKEVIATVALQKEAENFAVEGSRFWVVMPKVNFQGISGLETFFEGTYISVLPGRPEAPSKFEFKGKMESETIESVEDTVAYFLESDNAGSLSTGDSVSFRGMNVGSISKIFLSKTAQMVTVQINVPYKFVKLFRTNTAFWRKVAVQANLGLFNSEVKIGSLDSLLHGGITIFTPDPPGPIAKASSRFPLSPAPPKDSEKWNPVLEDNVK